jgi:Ca2+-binding EF-hand superfamily protein
MKLVQIFGMLLLSSAGAVMANDMTPGDTSSSAQSGTTRQETSTTTSTTSSKSMDKNAFDKLDTNKDGYLTKMEAEQAGTVPNFTTADRNGDGRLDPTEYAAVQKSSMSSESSMSQSHSVTSSNPSNEEDQ